jgi:UDP-N-acetylmuramoyl-L-alanyl-D-glutamate--2,6-diaminopimelate ligase
MNLSSLLRALPAYEIENERDVEITRVVADSRQVTPGALFVAIRGENVDGARFIPDALARGAVAIVAEVNQLTSRLVDLPLILVPNARLALAHLCAAWHDYPSRNLRVIGVTGTDGKTTTCTLIENILLAAGHTVGAITTVGARIGGSEIDTGFHTTTPDAPEVQKYLAQMVAAGIEYAVIEATSHGLAQHRVSAVDFDVAVVTNITHEHLDFHRTWENYRDAKALLFRALTTSHRKPRTAKVSVLNADDNARGVFDYLRGIEADEYVVYSANSKFKIQNSNLESRISNLGFVFARDIQHSASGLTFVVDTPFGELLIESPLIGRFNVSNILAAIGAGIARRVPFAAMRAGIKNTRGVVGRMEAIRPFGFAQGGQNFSAMIDFAHTPNALRVALETAREIAKARVIVVFGCAGLRDVQKRAMMGKVAGQLADVIVVTAEDPRTESLDAIIAQIEEGLIRAGRVKNRDYFIVNDRAEAIEFAVRLARRGDVVIACGKGHERSLCFGTTEYPWSDQEAMSAALDARNPFSPRKRVSEET